MRRPLVGRSEDGVAGTVGTIMALLVFLTFLSLITNQYVPVWMKEAEGSHMSDALGQFGRFKTSIDLQVLVAHQSFLRGEPYVPVTTFSSVKLGVDGVPIFAVSTFGDLRADQAASRWNVSFTYDIGGNNTVVPESACDCAGNVRLQVFNRYEAPQSLAYENGAIIRAEQAGQVVKGEPAFRVLVVEDTSVEIDFNLVQLFVVGGGGVTGVGTEGLSARLLSLDVQEYGDINTAIDITQRTLYGPAWYRFFNETLARAFGITMDYYDDFPVESELIELPGAGGVIDKLVADNPIYQVQSLWDSVRRNYAFSVKFKLDAGGDSITVLPIIAFRLLHAYVNVQVGTS